MAKKKFSAGVVGLRMGVNHGNFYRMHPDVELVADINQARLEKRGRKTLQVLHCYNPAEEMFEKEKLNVVSVAAPPDILPSRMKNVPETAPNTAAIICA